MMTPKRMAQIVLINAALFVLFSVLKLWEAGVFNEGFNPGASTCLTLLTPLLITFVVLSALRILWELRVARARTHEDQAQLEEHRKHMILFGAISAVVLLTLVLVW